MLSGFRPDAARFAIDRLFFQLVGSGIHRLLPRRRLSLPATFHLSTTLASLYHSNSFHDTDRRIHHFMAFTSRQALSFLQLLQNTLMI